MPSQADVECLLALSSSREKRKQSCHLLIVWASFKSRLSGLTVLRRCWDSYSFPVLASAKAVDRALSSF